jgi:hypothetical protein
MLARYILGGSNAASDGGEESDLISVYNPNGVVSDQLVIAR